MQFKVTEINISPGQVTIINIIIIIIKFQPRTGHEGR